MFNPEDVTFLEMHQNLNKMRLELRNAQLWLDRATLTHLDLETKLLDAEDKAIAKHSIGGSHV